MSGKDYKASHNLNSLISLLARSATNYLFTVMCSEVNENQISDVIQDFLTPIKNVIYDKCKEKNILKKYSEYLFAGDLVSLPIMLMCS